MGHLFEKLFKDANHNMALALGIPILVIALLSSSFLKMTGLAGISLIENFFIILLRIITYLLIKNTMNENHEILCPINVDCPICQKTREEIPNVKMVFPAI